MDQWHYAVDGDCETDNHTGTGTRVNDYESEGAQYEVASKSFQFILTQYLSTEIPTIGIENARKATPTNFHGKKADEDKQTHGDHQ